MQRNVILKFFIDVSPGNRCQASSENRTQGTKPTLSESETRHLGAAKRAQTIRAQQKGRNKKSAEQKGRRTKRARDHDVASPLHSRS